MRQAKNIGENGILEDEDNMENRRENPSYWNNYCNHVVPW